MSLRENGVRRAKGARVTSNLRLLESNLTPEQEAYCRARAMGMSIEEAITACGLRIKPSTAKAWERVNAKSCNRSVVDRINELTEIAKNNAILKSGLDREWVISRYMQVVERCMQAEPVLDKEGSPTGEYTFNASGANQALRALGDILGIFKPQEKKPGDEYEHLSDDDLTRIAQELAAQTGLLESAPRNSAPPQRESAGAVQALPQAS